MVRRSSHVADIVSNRLSAEDLLSLLYSVTRQTLTNLAGTRSSLYTHAVLGTTTYFRYRQLLTQP